MTLGFLCLVMGIAGIFMPVLPTTPFLLLASFFFVKSSDKLYNWLLNHKVFGSYVSDYIQHRSMRRSAKRKALATLWISMIISMFLVKNIYVSAFLIILGSLISRYILSLRELEA